MVPELTPEEVETLTTRGGKDVLGRGNNTKDKILGQKTARGWPGDCEGLQGIQCLWRVQSGKEVGEGGRDQICGWSFWVKYRDCVFILRAVASVCKFNQGVMSAGLILCQVRTGCCMENRLEGTEGQQGPGRRCGWLVTIVAAELERVSR